jgi:uncharacterized membrane protein
MRWRDSVGWLMLGLILVVGVWLAMHSAPPVPYLPP